VKPRAQETAEGFLFTDLYQITMAQLYFKKGIHEKQAQFDHFFRSYPDYGEHQAGYCINAGLDWLLDWIEEVEITDRDIEYLRDQTGREGKQLFEDDFLEWLRANGNFDSITLRSIPEGRVVHPNEPLNIVQGPLALAQILESPLLNKLNYQTLIATKAARVKQAGMENMTLEFGMRRAHGQGANAGARGALIGGADFTSNTGVSYTLGYPPKGTHAHSMVQAYMGLGETELDAFEAYADVYPDNCLLLVDTVDTLESGVPNAIKVFEKLREQGHEPMGIRLDSGDLAHLAVRSAKMLNEAGFEDTSIVLSNQLNEMVLMQIIDQIRDEAPDHGLDPERLIDRLVYGVGTRLITSKGDPSLGGVYKLVSIRDEEEWSPALKVSETPAKVPNPGQKNLWRIYDQRNKSTADLVAPADEDPRKDDSLRLHHPNEKGSSRTLKASEISRIEPLLETVIDDGEIMYDRPDIEEIRRTRKSDLDDLDTGVRRIMNPHIYHVSLTESLWNLKRELIEEAREKNE
jgi:nicotinate phosphoribosyltransferase